MSGTGTLPRGNILGTQVTTSSVDEALAWLEGAVAARQSTVMSAATVYAEHYTVDGSRERAWPSTHQCDV
jgi:hypothetical protein